MAEATWRNYLVGYGLHLRDGQVLLVANRWRWGERPEIVWTLPGGRAEEGEPIVEALRREFAEETGLAIAVGGLLYVTEVLIERAHQRFVSCVFAVEPVGGTLGSSQDEAIVEARFVPVDQLQAYLGYPTMRESLQRYLAHETASPFYRLYRI